MSTEKSQEVIDLERKLADLTSQVAALTGERTKATEAATAHETRATSLRAALVEVHRGTLLAGLIDPELASLAPAVEIDDSGKVSAESVKAVEAWKDSKRHYFKVEEPKADPKQEVRTHVSTPVVAPNGNEMTWETWDRLRKENPIEFAQRQPELIAWCKSQEQAARR